MSVVVFGQRPYGQVESHGGEHAETVFFHIQFMPLIPIRSQWVTSEPGDPQKTGFPIKLHLRSVAAAYLRWWGLVGGVVAACSGTPAGGIAGLVLLLGSVWSWTWTWRIGKHAQRRSDLDRLAFGHRCDPTRLTDDDRGEISGKLSNRLARSAEPRPPDDVARFGARDFQEAITAYGLLRLNSQRREAQDAARQLMSYAFDKLPSDGGPFRAAASTTPDASLEIATAIRVAVATEASRRKQRIARLPKRWFHRPVVQVIGLALASVMVLPLTVAQLAPARAVTARQLDGAGPLYGRVAVTCDEAPIPYANNDKIAVSMCAIGTHLLPVVHAAPPPLVALTDTKLYGSLHISLGYDRHRSGLVQHIAADPDVATRTYDFVFEQESALSYWLGALGLIVFDLLLALGWTTWVRALRRRRAAKRAVA